MFQHPTEIEYLVKEREIELLKTNRFIPIEKKEHQPISIHIANFMHELGHWLENLGLRLRRRYRPLTSNNLGCSGSNCRQAYS